MTNYEMQLYDNLVEYCIASPQEINLTFCVAGMPWRKALETILFVRTGYRTWEQFVECELNEE